MKGVFNYDNKFMGALTTLADLIILNILFLVCCLPVVTIGAAQAGIYTAMKVMADKEDDSSLVAAFFRGFVSGFGTVTLAFSILLVLILGVGYTALAALSMENMAIMAVLSTVGFCSSAVLQCAVTAFHSRFRCTLWQLLRNAWLLSLAQFWRFILVFVLVWSPALILLLIPNIFFAMMPVFVTVYFSLIYWLCYALLKKPLQILEDNYKQRQESQQEPAELTQS